MSVASGSSSCGNAFRSAVRTGKIHRGGMRISRGSVSISQDRNFSDQVSATHYPTSSSSSSSAPPPLSDRTAYSIKPNRGSSNLTGQAASEHLKELFNLPDSHTFSPKLSLQMFTHKSYRYNYLPKRITHEPSEEEKTQKYSQHNERLSFTGRRAIFTYFTIFLHATANINPTVLVPGSGFLKRNESLMGRLENLFHVTQTSQLVGSAWGTNELTRWDKNPLLDGSKANATTVQAIIGGIYNEFGSPAAHRAFHLHYLPNLVDQLRDPMVKERVEIIRRDLEDQFGKGIIVGQK